jgi:hypothetical protein
MLSLIITDSNVNLREFEFKLPVDLVVLNNAVSKSDDRFMQIHLSTLVIAVLLAGVLLGVNLLPRTRVEFIGSGYSKTAVVYLNQQTSTMRGCPLDFQIIETSSQNVKPKPGQDPVKIDPQRGRGVTWGALAFNVFCSLVTLIFVIYSLETKNYQNISFSVFKLVSIVSVLSIFLVINLVPSYVVTLPSYLCSTTDEQYHWGWPYTFFSRSRGSFYDYSKWYDLENQNSYYALLIDLLIPILSLMLLYLISRIEWAKQLPRKVPSNLGTEN